MPDGSLAIVALSVGCNYACLVCNLAHKEFLNVRIQKGLLVWMKDQHCQALCQGESMKNSIEQCFPDVFVNVCFNACVCVCACF